MIWQLIRQDGHTLPDAIRRGIEAHRRRIGTEPDTILCHYARVAEFRAATELVVKGTGSASSGEFFVGREEAA